MAMSQCVRAAGRAPARGGMALRVRLLLGLVAVAVAPLLVWGGVQAAEEAEKPYLWPLPAQYTSGDARVAVHADMTMQVLGADGTPPAEPCQTLEDAWQRYLSIMFPFAEGDAGSSGGGTGGGNGGLTQLRVKVDDLSEAAPQLETDESYSLSVPAAGGDYSPVVISAQTVYGALRAMETFSQLVTVDFDNDRDIYHVESAPWEIDDTPRFAHRGLLLDTSRHFQPLENIRRTIDGLSYTKMNVLHWHLSDTQSFPFESRTYPNLWDGAYTHRERYRQEDVAAMVEYARARGVRVMVEFDMPGHAGSWCTGYPEVCPSETCTQPLDPSKEATFDLITSLLGECTGGETGAGLFPDNFLHLGGDEVDTSCWSETPHIEMWMKENGYNTTDAYKYFVDRAAQIAIDQGRNPVQWVEVYENFGSALNPATIVHVWKEKSTMQGVVADGYRAILSDEDIWYLDHLDTTWLDMYNNEPYEGIDDPDQQALILGGQVCMWGETVDASDLDNTVWPRAAAFAERVWTPEDMTDSEAALDRIEYFRCLLDQREILAAPVNNANARSAPPEPGSCYEQRRRRTLLARA